MTLARLALLGLLGATSCRKTDEAPRRTEPWLANPSVSASSGAVGPLTFHFAPDSRVRFSVSGKKGMVKGHVPVATGTLTLDPRDLKAASATLDVDLTTLSIDTAIVPEGAPLGDSTPTALALQWLELGADVAPERRREVGQARFQLTSVETLSASGLDWRTARTKSAVRASIVGTVLLHGFRAPVRADVLLSPVESTPGAPRRLAIRSSSPLVITLAPHDISARSPSGTVDARAMARSADWVGKTARIELELVAEADIPKSK